MMRVIIARFEFNRRAPSCANAVRLASGEDLGSGVVACADFVKTDG